MPTTFLLVLASFLWMGLAYWVRRIPRLHAAMMRAMIAFDFAFPVYLYLTHDWGKRLIEQQEILSFLVWAHFGLGLLLYTLEVMQWRAGRRILAGDAEARAEHRALAKGIVLARVFVFATGALLYEPT